MADTPDLGSGAVRREGSSPFVRTIFTATYRRITSVGDIYRGLEEKCSARPGAEAQPSVLRPSGLQIVEILPTDLH